MADTPKRRPHRRFTDEFKAGVVRLVLDEGRTVGAAARDLNLTEMALLEWVRLLADGVNIRIIQLMLGHASVRRPLESLAMLAELARSQGYELPASLTAR